MLSELKHLKDSCSMLLNMVTKLVASLFIIVIVAGSLSVAMPPNNGQAGTTLSATKTANGFHERKIIYDWAIEKVVQPTSLEVKPSNSGFVAYALTATRTMVSDITIAYVRGEVCVTNSGDRVTENLKIVDSTQFKVGSGQYQDLTGATQTIIPDQQLMPGQTQCFSYEIAFTPVSNAIYRNVAKVTITNHSGHLGDEFGSEPKADFSIPSTPTIIEIDRDAELSDVQSCPTGFACMAINTGDGIGPWSFVSTGIDSVSSVVVTFSNEIKNASAQCGNVFNLDNTAVLDEKDSAEQRTDSARVTIYSGECPQIRINPKAIGFWKKHPTETSRLLPQILGGFNVDSFVTAKAVFDVANAKKCK